MLARPGQPIPGTAWPSRPRSASRPWRVRFAWRAAPAKLWNASRPYSPAASSSAQASPPPLPALEGLFGKPTVVNNVLSFAAVPTVLDKGAEFYKNYGMGRSRGTLPFQLAGNIRKGGLVEKAFGVAIPPPDLIPQNFRTVRIMAGYLASIGARA